MSLFNDPHTDNAAAPQADGYAFASEGFDNFMDDFAAPKQEQGVADDFDGLDDLPGASGSDSGDGTLPDHLQASPGVARASAGMLTVAIDSTLSALLGMLAQSTPDAFKADDTQRDELQQALTQYIRLKGGDIPPGVTLAILLVSIYGGKAASAVQLRRANKRNRELETEVQRLNARLEEEQRKNRKSTREEA